MLIGPPKALDAPKPTSSSKTITTLGAFAAPLLRNAAVLLRPWHLGLLIQDKWVL
jgi:hypothetical protein